MAAEKGPLVHAGRGDVADNFHVLDLDAVIGVGRARLQLRGGPVEQRLDRAAIRSSPKSPNMLACSWNADLSSATSAVRIAST